VFPLNEAVVNPKLADANKLAVALFRDDVTLANVISFVSCDEVNEFNEVNGVVI
jgi:hypothetical protein